MNLRLNEDEIACVKKLAERFEKNSEWVYCELKLGQGSIEQFVDPLELPADRRPAILGLMEHLGLITEVSHAVGCQFCHFCIAPKVTQVAREISEQENAKEEPRDIVEHIKTIARRNRILAWAIILISVLTGLMIFVNQLLQLLKTIGVMKTE